MTLPIPRGASSPFDLLAGQGQLVYTFVFRLVDATTSQFIRYLTPLVDQVPQLTHDTSQTIKRSVTLALGVDDTAAIDTIHHRVLIYLQLSDGTLYKLGRFMFTDRTMIKSTGGDQSSVVLMDEGFILDQPSEVSYPPASVAGLSSLANQSSSGANPIAVTDLIRIILETNSITAQVEDSDFLTTAAWSIGTSTLQTLADLATYGDFFPPWLNADNIFRMIRTFDPATKAPNFDWDLFPHVYADSVTQSDDLLSAPNRFIVIGNAANQANASISGGNSSGNNTGTIVGTYDVPASAPHSIQNRGFAVPLVAQMQVETITQANAVAQSIGLQSTLYQRTTLTTFPDPRHDSYDVIRWQGALWLELAWSMDLIAGGNMMHILRKVYS